VLELIVSVLLLIFCLALLYTFRQGPIFVPTQIGTVAQMVTAAKLRAGSKMADLGSGDGRVVIAFAKAGVSATGFEINPLLVWISRMKIKKAGVSDRAHINTTNFWSQNLGEYDCVTIFGIDFVMDRLSEKLKRELRPGAIVISNAFRLRKLNQISQIGSLIVYQK
jgi:precorrin-6B methylase 2